VRNSLTLVLDKMAGRRNSKKGNPILLLKYLTVQNYNLISARLHVAHWERCDWFYSTRSYRSRRGRPLIRTAVNRGTGAGTEALIRRP
jgi:hypothetical protein